MQSSKRLTIIGDMKEIVYYYYKKYQGDNKMYESILYEVLDKNSKNFAGSVFSSEDRKNSKTPALALGVPVSTACKEED